MMTTKISGTNTGKWLHSLTGALLLVSFFMPWVSWQKLPVRGSDFPSGSFFELSALLFKLENPFPQFAFSFYAFWLIPAAVVVSVLLRWKNQNKPLAANLAGGLSLALVTFYYFFSNTLADLGAGKNAWSMLQPFAWITVLAAISFIYTAASGRKMKFAWLWIIAAPLLVAVVYKAGQRYVMKQTFADTAGIPPDYSMTATGLLAEFLASDSVANKKYKEKIILVRGQISVLERTADSITVIQFADSTGSFLAFSFEKAQWENLARLQQGDSITVKGSCSGSMYSEILGTTTISFKRAALQKE